MSTADRRIPITIQAVPGQDDDLIFWLRCIPKGDKQQRLKDTLRAGIEAATAHETALESVKAILARIDAIASYASADAADSMLAAVNASLAEVLDIVRHEVQQEAKATRDFIGMAALTPSAKATIPTVTAAPQLDPEEAQRRTAAIKAKAQW